MKSETKISERRACILVGMNRLTFRYRPQIRDDAALRERMRNWPSAGSASATGVWV
jgi:hypothetical protein